MKRIAFKDLALPRLLELASADAQATDPPGPTDKATAHHRADAATDDSPVERHLRLDEPEMAAALHEARRIACAPPCVGYLSDARFPDGGAHFR